MRSENYGAVLIVRCSTEDGMGHLYRSLGLFRELSRKVETLMVLLGGLVPHPILDLDPEAWTTSDSDQACMEFVLGMNPSMVIFDTMFFDDTCFRKLAQGRVTCSLSPIFNCLPNVDLLFHRTSETSRNWSDYKNFPRIFKGLEYWVSGSPVDFVEESVYQQTIAENRPHIGISLGGTDSRNDTLLLLKSLLEIPEKSVFWVALGDGYSHSIDILRDQVLHSQHEFVFIMSNESFWKVFKNISAIICAGGITSYEAYAAGIPSITLQKNSHWRYLSQELEDLGVTKIVEMSEGFGGNSLKELREMITSPFLLKEMRSKIVGNRLFEGSRLVATTIVEILESKRTIG